MLGREAAPRLMSDFPQGKMSRTPAWRGKEEKETYVDDCDLRSHFICLVGFIRGVLGGWQCCW